MELIVETAVSQVTVFPERARVTVVGECELESGLHRLWVTELPLSLEADSVRATGVGTAQVRIISVDVQRQFFEETPTEKVQELVEQIEQVKEEMQQLADDKAGWEAHGRYLDGLRDATREYARGLSRGQTTVADQTALITFLQEQDTQMRTAIRDLDQQQNEVKRRLEKLQKELKQLSSARPRERNQVQIDIEVLSAGSFQPEISYVVNRAGWQPLYDLRLLEEGQDKHLEVTYIAQVTQNTGEDWEGVVLSVSTARPSLNQRVPELHPWYVDVYRPPELPRPQAKRSFAPAVAVAAAPMAEAEEMLAAPVDEAVQDLEREAEMVTADVQEGGTAVTFHVPGRTDIPSDGSPHKATLQAFNLQPEIDYLCIPKHTDAVYRRATVNNSGSGPLLAGSASLFVGDEFIGRTRLDYTPANGEVELLLGVEERITVERELAKRDVDKKMLRDQRRIRYGYEIELKNLLTKSAQVEVHDHIPVSRNEAIKVKLDQIKPEPAEHSDLNLLEWHLTIPPDTKQTILYEFLVEFPRTIKIRGISD